MDMPLSLVEPDWGIDKPLSNPNTPLDTQGYGADEPCQEDVDDDANGVLLSASVAGRVALGVRAGAKVRRLQRGHLRPFRLPRLCAEDQGYKLHAAVVIRNGDREGPH